MKSRGTRDPDTQFVWWSDPVSGIHCWHQVARVEQAGAGGRYGDTFVGTNRSYALYRELNALTLPAPGPNNLRRPSGRIRLQ